MGRYEQQRQFLKSNFLEFKHIKTDKAKGLPKPAAIKPYDPSSTILDLPEVNEGIVKRQCIFECIKERRSTRLYSEESLTLEELSYLLWATQGITGSNQGELMLRTVPCSGATHTFETYLFIMRIDGVQQGVYRYLPKEHKLLFMNEIAEMDQKIDAITLDQPLIDEVLGLDGDEEFVLYLGAVGKK